MLKFVRDIMRSGDAMPIVLLGTRMSDALVEMTAKSLGCVIIAGHDGRLMGIITDGDLRRHMRPNLPGLAVEQVMTRAPDTVSPDQLASEALELLNSLKRTQLIVVEADKPVGVVHVHDLLRAGVA
jgi:arabinose-5-phosphate isomerase